ncbi:metallophosphoesterase family protein, partial [Georgenia sp.]
MDDTERRPRRRWAWWHRQSTTTRRVARTTATLLVTGLLAAAVGVSSAGTHSSLGPHEAEYEVTLDREITVGLGPLGAVILDSPLPWPLGVRVQVAEIPSALQLAGSPTSGLLADLQAYGQLFGQPAVALADPVRGLVTDALGRTAVLWSLMLVMIAAGRLASRGRLRDELRGALARPGVAPLVGAVVVAVVAAVVVPTTTTPYRATGYSPAVLAGTPAEGARITGRLADLIETYGPVVKDAYLGNERFYDTAAAALAAEYAADPEARAPHPETFPRFLLPGPATGRDLHPPAVAADGVTDPVTLLLVSDMHCNVGMARLVATALEHSGAEVLLDAGDTVMSGTSVESYCVNAIAAAVPQGIPVVVSTGNHDSVTTAQQERDAGWTVLSGDPVEVAGIRVLGETDPTLTAVGSGTRPERAETIPELGTRLADVACAQADGGDPVDILLVHNPRVGGPTLDAGCARLQLSGHWHRTEGPRVVG